MKQIIQNLKNGNTLLEEVPAPTVTNGSVLIRTTKTLVSLGTERMLVEFGKANYIQKAKAQPEKVKQVFDKMKTDGVKPTVDAVFNKLGQPLPLGYCNVGIVEQVGHGVSEFKIGDRVVSNGSHAEFVSVPQNLVARIPDVVSDEEAVFTVIGAIGLQGIRLANPTFGETVVVIGLGLIGLITAELLKSNGCKVIAYDFDDTKVKLAQEKGITAFNPHEGTDSVKFVESFTKGIGADAVLITASTKSDDVISEAARMSRKRGRVILVGVVGLNINRAEFYEKEILFQVSCSYGPGRYDSEYEEKGNDYPIGFVRWTEKRNFEAILHALEAGLLDVKSLITDRVKLQDYDQIYSNMRGNSIASLIEYPVSSEYRQTVDYAEAKYEGVRNALGIIGAGNFTAATLLPAFDGCDANLAYIASSKGLSAASLAKKHNIGKATSDIQEVLNDESIDTVIITTRHNLHAKMTVDCLSSDKNVFVEKPLALNKKELREILSAQKRSNRNITVGFNRRFSPFAIKMRELLGQGTMNIVATMNAGMIPRNVWVHDLEIGGGRIIGEACHFIDLCSFLTSSSIVSVCMNSLGTNPDESTDNASILLRYENGSNAVINYFANGAKSYSKERIEVFSQEKVLVLDNWRKLTGYGFKGFTKMKSGLDKGHKKQFELLVDRVKQGGDTLIPLKQIVNTTLASFAAIESMKNNTWISVSKMEQELCEADELDKQLVN